MSTAFWEQVTQLKTTDCWPWNGGHDDSGRPLFNGQKAYRTAYQLRNGDLRSGNHVHHKCENCACVNPKHLVQLTPEEHRAAHDAIRLNDQETLRRIYSGQWRIDSINYEEERKKREAQAAERQRVLDAQREAALAKAKLEEKAKRERSAAFWANVRLTITIWAKYTAAAMLLGAIGFLVICVCSGRIWISSSGIQNNLSEDVSGRYGHPIHYGSEKIIWGMGDSLNKHSGAIPTTPVVAPSNYAPRAELVRLPSQRGEE